MRVSLPPGLLDTMGIKPIALYMLSSWIKAAAKCGFNVQPLFKEAGITVDLIRIEEARVSPLQLVSVFEQCVAMSADQYFPLVLGDTFAFESLPEFETLLTTSPTLRDALDVSPMVRKVMLPWVVVALTESGDEAKVSIGFDIPEPLLQSLGLPVHLVSHAFLASISKFGRNLIGSEDNFRAVHFKVNENATPYAAQMKAFFRVPVLFGQKDDALVFDRVALDFALEGAFPALHEQAHFLAQQRVGKETRRQGVAAELEELISSEPALLALGVEDMAERLSLHPRTLQRRLKDAGDSYLHVQARMRQRLAREWLKQGAVSIDDISIRLGFSDRRAFTAAFKRWESCTPTAWRSKNG